jgi:CheY-like chemotaxis protein
MPTALIVEDEPEANKLLALLVQLRGYAAVSAFTGGEALEAINRGLPPDIVFLDLMLPDINGYEVCRRLRSRKATSLVPVVMVTARIAAENRQQSFGVGADDYIAKPYTPDQIFQALQDADAWREKLGRNGFDDEGSIVFGPRSDDALRRVARLRNLLVARTSLDVEGVDRIGAALQALRASAERWGRQLGVDPVAVLEYRILPDRLVFTIDDRSEWVTRTRDNPAESWPAAVSEAPFTAVESRAGGPGLTLSWRCDAAGTGD